MLELVVRSAQVHALMPMMQFSVAPWRVLFQENAAICVAMAKLHVAIGPKMLALAKQASKTGELIVKPMAMAFPGGGYETIKDQFVLGDEIIVAPVALTREDFSEDDAADIAISYAEKPGRAPEVIHLQAADGAQLLR